MNRAHLYTVARLYSVDEGDLVTPERMAKALVRIWQEKGLRRSDVTRYTGVSTHSISQIYELAGVPKKQREPAHA
jgi:hypothetical protein